MKLRSLTTAVLLTLLGWGSPVLAQNPQPSPNQTPTTPSQPDLDRVLTACSQDRADTLPNPFRDLEQTHWAYKAVLSVYYCGPYRGSIPPEQYKEFLLRQSNERASATLGEVIHQR